MYVCMYLLIPLGVTRRFILKGSVPEPFYKLLLNLYFLMAFPLLSSLFPFLLSSYTHTHALSYLILTYRPSPFSFPHFSFPLSLSWPALTLFLTGSVQLLIRYLSRRISFPLTSAWHTRPLSYPNLIAYTLNLYPILLLSLSPCLPSLPLILARILSERRPLLSERSTSVEKFPILPGIEPETYRTTIQHATYSATLALSILSVICCKHKNI